MQINLLSKKNFLAFLLFSLIFLFGIFSFKDYGISTDEQFHRENGSFYYNYAKSFLSGPNSLETKNSEKLIKENLNLGGAIFGTPSVQPVFFDIIAEFFIEKLNIKNSKDIYQFRHLLNFLFFFIGLCFFYKIIDNRYKSHIYALIGVLFLFLSPRFFAESFYNQKDIVFLSLTIINIYFGMNFIKNPNFKNTFAFSLSSALAFDTRIMSVISIFIILFILLLKSLRGNELLKKNLKFIVYFFPITFIFIIVFWPYIWNDPINNFLFGISQLLSADFSMTSLYMGEFILSKNAPWHYPIVWIGITSPIIVILFFLFGLFFLIRRIIFRLVAIDNNSNDIWRGDNEMIDIYFLLMILLTIFLFINKGIAYDGWRLLYFIYPSIIMIALFGIYYLNLHLKLRLFKTAIYLAIILNLSYLVFWNYKFHPHQYVYFNFLFKNKFNNNFEKDYWGLSNTQSINYIIDNNIKYPIKIGTKSFASLEYSLLMLKDEDKNKVSITYNLSDAEFIITNYRIRQKKNFIIDKKKYRKYYEITVDDVPINTVYRKIK
tara:strand:- start:355 stop:1992 length:1638 start_codon:yes stop_codon:yes gene_type:complete